jgi:hypothetical protein
MSHPKKASKEKRRRKAVPVLSAVGLSLSLAGSASGAPTVDVPPRNTALSHEIILAEEEISDVSLATFYVFDKENAGTFRSGAQLARGGCGEVAVVEAAVVAAALGGAAAVEVASVVEVASALGPALVARAA